MLTTLFPPLPGLPLSKATKSAARRDTAPRKKFATKVENHPWPDKNHNHRLSKVRVGTRMVSHTRRWEHILIYPDGSCLNQNSKTNTQHRRAGCSVVFGMSPPGVSPFQPTSCSFRLEDEGSDGDSYVAISDRAELRAATAALECRMWGTQGWRTVTIATDSTYVVEGITNWVAKRKS